MDAASILEDPDLFQERLNRLLHPSGPVTQLELLRGRGEQLIQIERALATPGMSVFIHGDRGVGKTSLAQTAAFMHHPSKSEPVLLSCDPSTSATYVLREMVATLVRQSSLPHRAGPEVKAGLDVLGVLKVEVANRAKASDIPEPKSVNEAARLVSAAIDVWRGSNKDWHPVAVIDEFDRLASDSDRQFFGDLVKHIGDHRIPVRLIFCGVGRGVTELLATHPSCYRYIESVELSRLGYEARMEILSHVEDELGVKFEHKHVTRIATISDGFPYYVHLIGSRVLWELHDRPNPERQVRLDHFNKGVDLAVASCLPYLKAMYEKAVQKYSADYEHVLWAVAADTHLQRRSTDVYGDYVKISKRLSVEPVSRDVFNRRTHALKHDRHGNVLIGTRTGWYEFREPMLRGFCRLVAKRNGLDLGEEY